MVKKNNNNIIVYGVIHLPCKTFFISENTNLFENIIFT